MNTPIQYDKITELLASGNLDQFTPKEKVEYLSRVCEATGLNPLTRPFEWLRLNGKTVLYASKGCADQLRKINGISIRVTEKKIEDGVLFITVEGTDKSGRTDTDLGALPVGNLKGDQLANAVMKCLTKAKRRLTLSMCGLGIMDESEFDTLDNAFEEGKQEMVRIDAAKERIEVKAELAENMDEVSQITQAIQSSMATLTQGMTTIEKGKAMNDVLGIQRFSDISKLSLSELKIRHERIKELITEKEVRSSKKKEDKPSFVLES